MRGNVDSIGDMLCLTAEKHPDKTAVVFGDQRISYRTLNSRVNRLANALIDLGIKKGDKVAYLYLNCPEFMITWFAVAKAGGVGVPLNFGLVSRELAYQIDNSDSVALLFSPMFKQRISEIRGGLEKVVTYISDGEDGTLDFNTLLDKYPDSEPDVDISLYDGNLILYTAGTTGRPKGAVLTHRNSLFNAFTCCIDYGMKHEDILQVIPPLFHSASSNCFSLPGVVLGCTLILHARFDPVDMLSTIEREKVTVTWGPATLWRGLMQFPDFKKYDLSSVRRIGNGAMYMPAEMRAQLLALFPRAEMMDIYGMTEASPGVTMLAPNDVLRKASSVGKPLTLTDARMMNEKGQEVAPGEVGEIAVRGNFFEGYYKMPEATTEAIKGRYFYTGDMGKKDEEGFIYLVDRKKDMIVSGGENVYSKEVEEVLQANPAVVEAAVIGVPHEKWGEMVVTVVSTRAETTEEEIISWCKQNLASYKCPKKVHFVKEIPKNPAGKIVKGTLKEMFSSH